MKIIEYEEQSCEYVLIDVLTYNNNALEFYDKNGYHPRMAVHIKKYSNLRGELNENCEI